MSSTLEINELNKFYQSINVDIKSQQLSDDDGGNLEQLFTLIALNLLSEAGETENAMDAYHEGQLGTKNQHKINAYAEPDNYETIDLFITIFKGLDQPQRITKDEIETAVKRISNFFRKAKYKDYIEEIEESSQIFDFANTLANSEMLKENLVRVNAIILTDGIYGGDNPENQNISGIPVFYRIIDINYLYNISEKSHIPIEIDFKKEGFIVPCIISPSENDQYQSYLAIIPGEALAAIYERYGSRLLEQNVRSFLQFTGKINKGIRKTILKEPHMFLAYNNGIAATAEELDLFIPENGKGYCLSKVKDFQIVNGGQTTASIYHSQKKDKADISKIFVQVKLSVVKNKDKFSEIVSSISEFANTQNKVSVSDLSSNRPYHIELEKLSRNIFTPHVDGKSVQQTKWFYERARGQYKNARVKEGFTASKQKAFDLRNPKKQMFSKEDLAKYLNAYQEVYDGKKLAIGPHIVVRGNQKNYVQFMNYNTVKQPDSICFEDVISMAIIFRNSEKLYGVKPDSIGDMRYITVPYAISYLNYQTNNKLDLFKIWKNQSISEPLKRILYELMVKIESFIKSNAPGSLYGEWAKREECWEALKKQTFDIDFSPLKSDFGNSKRSVKSETDIDAEIRKQQEDLLYSYHPLIYKRIERWGSETGSLTLHQRNLLHHIASKIMEKKGFTEIEVSTVNKILDIVSSKASEILELDEELLKQFDALHSKGNKEITLDSIKKIVQWDRKNKRLAPHEYTFMAELADGKKTLNDLNKKKASWYLNKVTRFGYLE